MSQLRLTPPPRDQTNRGYKKTNRNRNNLDSYSFLLTGTEYFIMVFLFVSTESEYLILEFLLKENEFNDLTELFVYTEYQII